MTEHRFIETSGTTIFAEISGHGDPLLLLHGFPETHLMWRQVAPLLADQFTVVAADLRGYGNSGCPASDDRHEAYSKRAMARDMLEVMRVLGFQQFAVAGHDRGGRVAYRLALDHPDNICALSVLDIIPTKDAWENADKDFALAYWPWIILAQSSPLPEQFILSNAETIVKTAINEWGTSPAAFPESVTADYTAQLRNAEHVRAICEEYRAASSVDYAHDCEDTANKRKIQCPVRVLWGEGGPLDSWYNEHGGPVNIWKKWTLTAEGQSVSGGHFFPEQHPDVVAKLFSGFFKRG